MNVSIKSGVLTCSFCGKKEVGCPFWMSNRSEKQQHLLRTFDERFWQIWWL